jgi:hypothetical protein
MTAPRAPLFAAQDELGAPCTSAQRLLPLLWIVLGASVAVGEGLVFICMLGIAACLWRQRRAVQWNFLRETPLQPLFAGFGVYLGCGLLALVLSPYGVCRPAELGRLMPYALVPLALWSRGCVPCATFRRVGWAFAAALAVAALFGVAQWAYDVRPLEALSREAYGQAPQALVPGRSSSVAGGFYFHRLKMAHVLVVGGLGAAASIASACSWRRRIGAGLLLCLFAVTLQLTYARSASLALGAACACLLATHSRGSRRLLLAAAVCSGAALGLLRGPRQALIDATLHAPSHGREVIWAQAVRILDEHPLGIGLGNYPSVVRGYYAALPPTPVPRTYPHHVGLCAWAECGPLGLLGYLYGGLSFVTLCWRRLQQGKARQAAARGLAGAVAFAVLGLSHDVLYHNAVAFAFCGLLALTLATMTAQDHEKHAK